MLHQKDHVKIHLLLEMLTTYLKPNYKILNLDQNLKEVNQKENDCLVVLLTFDIHFCVEDFTIFFHYFDQEALLNPQILLAPSFFLA